MDSVSDCGCCEKPVRPPKPRDNPTGEPAIGYRFGTHAGIKAKLLARLSSTEYPALEKLRTRADDDFTIALCDAAAVMLDVLSFYQERYANELYLRTAVERRSVLELSRLIGYRLGPGVAASTHLAFLLEEAPGNPALAAEPVTIPAGTRVQSVPGPGEEPQTFETVDPMAARVEWNAIPVQRSEHQALHSAMRDLFLKGINTQVQTGDVILLVGDERLDDPTSTRWKARAVSAVETDPGRDLTRLVWADPLGPNLPEESVRAFVFRTRTALFGHNAADARLFRFSDTENTSLNLTEGAIGSRVWKNYKVTSDTIDLDGSFPKVLTESWFLLADGGASGGTPSLPGTLALYQVDRVTHRTRADFGLSGRVTRLKPDTTAGISSYESKLKETSVLAQSEELALAERPLAGPLYSSTVTLGRRSVLLVPKQMLAVSGKRQRLRVVAGAASLSFVRDDGTTTTPELGDSFTLVEPPVKVVGGTEVMVDPAVLPTISGSVLWRVADRHGRKGSLDAPLTHVELQPALKDDPVVEEVCRVADGVTAVTHPPAGTTLVLKAPLSHVYDRSTTTVCANLARATQGETVSEIAGSGNAAAINQAVALKQTPLTWVSAATDTGRQSTIAVRVGGMLWEQVDTLFERNPQAHVYALRQEDDGRTIVQFGDGVEGARLPTGQDNIRFTYRKFLGSGGNLPAGRLTSLIGRPLGVKSVAHPGPASGGEDPESRDEARRNAPLTMLTLGRAVSLQDYTDFARTFAGIAKAQAIWVGHGPARGIFVTVAGPEGDPVAGDSDTMKNLVKSLRQYGDQLVPLHVASYTPVTFSCALRIKVAAVALADDVLPAVEQALRNAFSFSQRDFGQTVSLDEVMAVIHTVPGVEAADVDQLRRMETGAQPSARLFASPAWADDDGTLHPAELLTLDPAPLLPEIMP